MFLKLKKVGKSWIYKNPSRLLHYFLSGQVRTLTFSYTTLHLLEECLQFFFSTLFGKDTHTLQCLSLFLVADTFVCLSFILTSCLSFFLSVLPWIEQQIWEWMRVWLILICIQTLFYHKHNLNPIVCLSFHPFWEDTGLSVHLFILSTYYHVSLFIVHFAVIVFLRQTVH